MSTAPEFNLHQYEIGLLNMAHVSRLTSYWQQGHAIDPVDGKCGSNTRKSLETITVPPCTESSVLMTAWSHANADIGKGGDGQKNNEGVYLDEIRDRTELPKLGGGAWCAVAISNWIILSDYELGHAVKSRGAPGLVQNMIDAGAYEIEPEDMPRNGVGVGLYSRGNINRGLHHVRMLLLNERGNWEGIGGNERGDKVNHQNQTPAQVEQRLVKIVRF